MAELLESLDAPRNTRAQPAPSPRDSRTPEQSFAYLMAAASSGVVPAASSAPVTPVGEAPLSGGSWAHRVGPGADATALAEQRLAAGSSRHDPEARLAGSVETQGAGTDSGSLGAARADAPRAEPALAAREPRGGASTRSPALAPGPSQANQPSSAAESRLPAPDPSHSSQPSIAGPVQSIPTPGSPAGAVAAPPSGSAGVQGVGASTRGGAGGQGDSNARGEVTARAPSRGAARAKPADAPAAKGTVREDVPAQAMRGLAALLRRKGGIVTMRLTPEALGDLKVSMRVENNRVWARIQASTASARDLLKDQRESLRSALEARGLKVERLEIAAEPNPVDRGAPTGAGPEPWGGLAGGDLRDRRQPPERELPNPGGGPGIVASGGAEADESIVWLRGARPRAWAEPSANGLRWRVDAVA